MKIRKDGISLIIVAVWLLAVFEAAKIVVDTFSHKGEKHEVLDDYDVSFTQLF